MPLAADVLFPLPLAPFRYLVPHDEEPAEPGARLVVPWQGGVRTGLVVAVEEISSSRAGEYREAISWLDRKSFVARGAPRLLTELAELSGSPAGVVLSALLPVGLHRELVHEVQAVEGAPVLGLPLPTGEWVPGSSLAPGELELYRRQGLVRERVRPKERTETRLVPRRGADGDLQGKARENQRRALSHLEELGSAPSAAQLARDVGVPESAARALISKGYAAYVELPSSPPPLPAPRLPERPLEPLGEGLPEEPVTLVTGGLRKERLAAMLPTLQRDLAAGGSVLVLAPEAAFLSEAASLLASRLPLLMLSGEAGDEQRELIWEEAASGRPVVLAGTYSAMLAPLSKTVRIVVLEAGSGTYKLPAGPRLFVPSAVRRLAAGSGVPLVLSDVLASPEMRSWAGVNDRSDRSDGLSLPSVQVELSLPLRRQRAFVSDLSATSGWPVGSDLALVLRQVQERGRQAIILASRRGFSAAFSCQECGHTVMCPNCDLPLRYHRTSSELRCHQCGHGSKPDEACPDCDALAMGPGRAAGTEWVASSLSKLLPEMPIARLDADRQDDLSALRQGRPGVLVATTAAFRIPPLPNVSLIGVTLLDTHLNVSDFRAAEEASRLLLQLPELAGGGRPLVVVQTYQPDHEVLSVLRGEGEEALREYEATLLERRRRFGYPPFGHLAKVQVSSRDRATAEREAQRLVGSVMTATDSGNEVWGPVPAPVARVRGLYSFLAYLRSPEERGFKEILNAIPPQARGVRIRVDVDPRDVAEFLE